MNFRILFQRPLATMILLGVAFLGQRASAANSRLLGCWDGTFAYNFANIRPVADGFEITMSGSSMEGDPIQIGSGVQFELQNSSGNLWHPGLGLYVKLPRGSCTIDQAANIASCHALVSESNYKTAFVTWNQFDINGGRDPIVPMVTDGSLRGVDFVLSQGLTELTFTIQSEQSVSTTKRVSIDSQGSGGSRGALNCGNENSTSGSFISLQFPNALRRYLRSN